MKMESSKILPCPFCGGKSAVHKYFSAYYAKCRKCKTISAPYPTPEEAAQAWNARQDPPPIGIAREQFERTVNTFWDKNIYGCRDSMMKVTLLTDVFNVLETMMYGSDSE